MRRLYFLLTFFVYSVFMVANGLAQVSTNGLVAHYKMDGDAQDASGNGNHGTAQNGVVFEVGKFGKAARFDGVNGRISVSNHASLNFSSSFTVSFWSKMNVWEEPDNNARGIISKKPNDNSVGYVFYKDGFHQSKINFRLRGGATYDYIPSNSDVIINKWEFWSMVYNSSTGKVLIYKNGVLDKTENTGDIGDMTNTSPLYIGFSETWNGYFNGSLDDIRIYNRALSDAEVSALYGSENSQLTLITPMRFGGGLSTLNVGTAGYGFTASIKNNGSTSWVGDVYLKVKGGTPKLLSSNNVIAAGGTYNLSTNFLPETSQIGQNVIMELLTKQGNNDFVRVLTVNGTVNPLTVNIEAASTVPVVKDPFLRLNQSEVNPGGIVQIVGGNFEPNTNVTIGTSPSIAGATYPTVTAGADGSISTSFVVPANTTGKYLTFVAYDVKRTNKTVSLVVKQPAEVATLSITSPYKAGETINITPNGKVSITFFDKLLKGASYPQSGASRSYRYEIGYQLAGSTIFNSLYQMPVETGLLNTELQKTVTFSMIGSNFSTVSQSGGWPLKFVIKDMYNNQRVAESVQVNINVVQNISKVSLKWDRSFTPTLTEDPVGIAADGVARMYLVVEKNSPTGSPIQSVSVVLANPESNRDPNNFNNGTWLGRVKYAAQQNNNQYSEEANGINTITAQNNSTNADGKYWFWYVAPDDFMRDGLPEGSNYTNDSGREVAAKFTVTYADGTSELVTKYILIVRPPLMMVHGLASDETAWNNFGLNSKTSLDFNLVPVKKAVQMWPGDTYNRNARVLLNMDSNPSNDYSSSFSSVLNYARQEFKFAVAQVDYVAHSMGGCMVREIFNNDDLISVFFEGGISNKNYKQGYINKFMTINTPHNGSPGADMIAGFSPAINMLGETVLLGLSKSFDKLKSFMVFPSSGTPSNQNFSPSNAVKNLQTNKVDGGIIFRETRLPSHLIASDIATGYTKSSPLLLNDRLLYDISPLNTVIGEYAIITPPFKAVWPYLYSGLVVAGTPFYDGTEPQWVVPFVEQYSHYYKLQTARALFSPKDLISIITNTFKYYGQYNDKFEDYMWNGDLIVPLKSQLAGQMSSSNGVPTVSNATILTNDDPVVDGNMNHIEITDKIQTSNRVKQLLNASVSSSLFSYIPANNEPQRVYTSLLNNKRVSAFQQLNTNRRVDKFDSINVKILLPTRNQNINVNTINSLSVRVSIKDTTGLKSLTLMHQYQVVNDSIRKKEYVFNIANNPSFIGKNTLYATGTFISNDSIIYLTDTLSIQLVTTEELLGFYVLPKFKPLGLFNEFLPTFKMQYNSFITNQINSNKLAISISNPACLSYNTQTGQFKGTQKGEAVVIFTYDGIFKDTMYVAVGGGGLPYSQQIQTSNVPVTGDGTICTGATISVPFTTTGGVFDVGNQYIVQLSDASGENFVSLTTTGTSSPLLARIPNGLSNADTYKIRVVSTSPPVIGSAAAQTLKIRNQDATPIVSVQTGNWNDPNTWSCKRIPSASDNVTIKAGHRVNLSVGAVGQCRNLITERTAIFDCPVGAVFLANPNQ